MKSIEGHQLACPSAWPALVTFELFFKQLWIPEVTQNAELN